jgi:dihydroxyacid dehydratase/phosphogluconate dehydratase
MVARGGIVKATDAERPCAGIGSAVMLPPLPPFEPRVTSRWLRRYARFVTSADKGAVLLD